MNLKILLYIFLLLLNTLNNIHDGKFRGKHVKDVFQCRIKPGIYKKKPETLGFGKKILIKK